MPNIAYGKWISLNKEQKKELKKMSFKDGNIRERLKYAKKFGGEQNLTVVMLGDESRVYGWGLGCDRASGDRAANIYVKKKYRKNGYGLTIAKKMVDEATVDGKQLSVFPHDDKSTKLFDSLKKERAEVSVHYV